MFPISHHKIRVPQHPATENLLAAACEKEGAWATQSLDKILRSDVGVCVINIMELLLLLLFLVVVVVLLPLAGGPWQRGRGAHADPAGGGSGGSVPRGVGEKKIM